MMIDIYQISRSQSEKNTITYRLLTFHDSTIPDNNFNKMHVSI